MSEMLDSFKKEISSFDIKKIDIDDPKNYDFADQYKVKSIPLIIFEREDKIIERITGSVPKSKLVELIQKHYE